MVLDSNYTTIHEWEWQSCYLLRVAGLGSARVRRLNPAYRNGRVVRRGSEPMRVLAPATPAVEAVETVTVANAAIDPPAPVAPAQGEAATSLDAAPTQPLPD